LNNLQVYVWRLWQTLGVARVRTISHGYGAVVEAGELDAETFARLTGKATSALVDGCHPRARALLDKALQLWRGAVLADRADVPH
jgi:hypothetical protein